MKFADLESLARDGKLSLSKTERSPVTRRRLVSHNYDPATGDSEFVTKDIEYRRYFRIASVAGDAYGAGYTINAREYAKLDRIINPRSAPEVALYAPTLPQVAR